MSSVQLDHRGLLISCEKCGRRNRLAYERLDQTFRCGECHTELNSPNVPVDISDERVFDGLISKSAIPVLVDFWAPWCGPCKMVAPEFAKVAAEGPGRWLVAKVNTEKVTELARRYGISAIPTMILFEGGREVAQRSGALPAAAIRQFIEQAEITRR